MSVKAYLNLLLLVSDSLLCVALWLLKDSDNILFTLFMLRGIFFACVILSYQISW